MRGQLYVDVFQQGHLLASYQLYRDEMNSMPSLDDYLSHGIERAKREIAISIEKAGPLTAKLAIKQVRH